MRILSILVGAVFVYWIAHGLHTNPRWTWSPGEGELPRDVVALYMDTAYKQGNVDEAMDLFYTPKTVDQVPYEHVLPNNKPFDPQVKRVIAEGFNVAVEYSAENEVGATVDYLEVFNIRGGRVVTRERSVLEPAAPASSTNDIQTNGVAE